MGTKLFVGGLPWRTDDAGLTQAFEKFGTVTEARVIYDRETGRSRGFGFVTFSTDDEAEQARAGMDGSEIEGRRVSVRQAEDRRGGGGSRSNGRGPDTFRKGRPPGGPPRDRSDRPPRGPRPPRDDHGSNHRGSGGYSDRSRRSFDNRGGSGGNTAEPAWRSAAPPAPETDDWSEDRPRRRDSWEKKKKAKKKRNRWDDDDW